MSVCEPINAFTGIIKSDKNSRKLFENTNSVACLESAQITYH